MEEGLGAFLWLALLAPEESVPAPAPPAGLSPALQADCEAIACLIAPARAGDVAALLVNPWFGPFQASLARAGVQSSVEDGGLSQLREDVRRACTAFSEAAPPSSVSLRGFGLTVLAVSSLQLYLRTNWTGPPAKDSAELPFEPSTTAEGSPLGAELLEALEVDGEPAYELLCGPGYLWLAALLLEVLPGSGGDAPLATGTAVAVWRARCAFTWQLSLAEASERGLGQSPWLFKVSIGDLAGDREAAGPLVGENLLAGETLAEVLATTLPVLETWRQAKGRLSAPAGPPRLIAAEVEEEVDEGMGEMGGMFDGIEEEVKQGAKKESALSGAPAPLRAALLCEVACRLVWYGRFKAFASLLAAACGAIDFHFEVTGELGIKRKYQVDEFAQMVVKTSTGRKAAGAAAAASEDPVLGPLMDTAPNNLSMLNVDDMNDVLEVPRLSATVDEEERAKVITPLSPVQQVLLLARNHYLWASTNPNDEMILQEVNAIAQRVLVTDEKPRETNDEDGPMTAANWLTFSAGLWYRCKAEHHRNKTRERASFQLQSLTEQFDDKKPSAGHRLLVVHGAGYAARFHLQREMGTRMMRMGMVSTAHEQFKKLRMWPEAVECLMIAERNVEAKEMVRELLETSPTPRLWCCLGDLEKDPKYYEKAWEVSKRRFARAQRSLGREYFTKDNMEKAVECFRLALEINPLHHGVWFTMGVAQIRLERWDDAINTFSRCLGVDDENSEAWANHAAAHASAGNLKAARSSLVEATKRARTNWKMWESFIGICLKLRDIQGVIQGMRRLVELDRQNRLQESVLGMLTLAVIDDHQGLYEGKSGGAFRKQLMDFLLFVTTKCSSVPCHWRFLAELQDISGLRIDALESRLKQCRALQAQLWDEKDPITFKELLEDLVECLQTVEKSLQEACLAEQAAKQTQSFAYLVRNAAKQLQAKADQAVNLPEWEPSCGVLSAIADRLEARAAGGGA